MGEAETITYKENGTGPVRTFTSEDPEGAGIDWDVTGTDADDFMISGGVLTFKEPPNYEKPTARVDTADRGMARDAGNTYMITIRATEMRGSGESRRALTSMTDVTVTVENVDEPGVIMLNWLEPEVDTVITATLMDPDDGVTFTAAGEGWEWERSTVTGPQENVNGHWAATAGPQPLGADTLMSDFTPAEGDASTATLDKFLRVVVTYTDTHGAEKRAVKKSYMPVRAEVTSVLDGDANPENGSPDFDTEMRVDGGYPRMVSEAASKGDNVGNPVQATDPDAEDTLTYQLDSNSTADDLVADDADVHSFSINKRTGQIMVAMTLDADSADGRRNDAEAGKYEVYVTTTDPSGERAYVKVNVTVTQANDAPKIWMAGTENNPAPGELSVAEQNSDDIDGTPGIDTPYDPADLMNNEYKSTDEDAIDLPTWSLTGEDMSQLKPTQSNGSVKVEFKDPPDYEAPGDRNGDNIYKVMLRVTDNGRLYDERPISIMVTNVKETGELTFSTAQPLVGEAITAMVSDPDEGVATITWQWFRSDDQAGTIMLTPIMGATSETYTPTDDDKTKFLRAEATYIDALSYVDMSSTPNVDERVQFEATSARVPDEDTADSDDHRVYKVGAITDTAVKVAGEEQEEEEMMPPEFMTNAYDREVAENARVGDYVGAPITAARGASYNLSSSNGDDAFFDIDIYGQITVKDIDTAAGNQRPDFDYEDKSVYTVSITVGDGEGNTDVATVTIRLINLNESPYFTETSRTKDGNTTKTPASPVLEFEENRTAAVYTYQATEPDGDGIRWSVKGTHAPLFTISSDGSLRFMDPPDYENGKGTGTDMEEYMVTVVATETVAVDRGPKKSAELPVTVTVTDKDEKGTVGINWLQPEVDTPIMATVTDPDIDATNATFTWYKSKNPSPNPNPDPENLTSEWEMVGTGSSYTPKADDTNTANENESDIGRFLLARASYSDGTTATDPDLAVGVSHYVVRADVSPEDNGSPDFAHDEVRLSISESRGADAVVGTVVIDPSTREQGEFVTYTREVAPDAINAMDVDFFKVDKATGQISLAKPLSAEANDGRTYPTTGTLLTPGEYRIEARVTDPSDENNGNTNRDETEDRDTDTILVIITATNVNEAPKIAAPMEMSGALEMMVMEKDSSKKPTDDDYYMPLTEINDNAYTAEDEDGDLVSWRLAGVDGSLFQIGSSAGGQQIVFKTKPDYEDPQDADADNVYHVTIQAYDTANAAGSRAVRIQVMNVNEEGMLELTPEAPHLEGDVMASLMDYDGIMTDPDGMQTITSWEWYRTDNDVPVTVIFNNGVAQITPTGAGPIGGRNTATYTIAEGDVGKFLHARVTYRDGYSMEDDPVTDMDERDEDNDQTSDVDESRDQELIAKTMNAVAPEAPGGTDPTDMNEAPMFDPASLRIEVPENTPSTGYVGMPVTATDEDLGDGNDTTNLTYELLGANVSRFALAPMADDDAAYYDDSVMRNTGDGQIVVRPVTHLDYESQRNTFDVEVAATDSEGLKGSATVTIVVTNVNESPSAPMGFAGGLTVSGAASPHFNEDETDLMVGSYSAVGPQGANATFTLSGTDAGAFTLGSSSGELSFRTSPDYEMPADANDDNMYELMITAQAGGETSTPRSIVVGVVNVDEPGRVTFWRDSLDATDEAIMVGDMLGGAVDDQDGNPDDMLPLSGMYTRIDGANITSWQWAKSMDMNTWTDLATTAEYTVMDTDAGYYLRATAMYEDREGAGKTKSEMTEAAVDEDVTAPGDDLIAMYDGVANGGNGDGMIQKLEYLAALDHFLDEVIDRDDLLTVLDALIDFLTS